MLVNSGAEAVENAVKIARAATGRPAVDRLRPRLPRPDAPDDGDDPKLVYKQGFGPLAPEVYRAPAPYPYRGVTTDDALVGLEHLFKSDVDPQSVACVVLETVQGEGGFIPMPPEFLPGLKRSASSHGILYVADEVQSGCGRTGPVWAIEHLGVEPDLLWRARRSAAGCRSRRVTGRAEVMDAVHPGGLGGTFGGNPVSWPRRPAPCSTRWRRRSSASGPTRSPAAYARGSTRIAADRPQIGEVRGLGPMLAIEFATPSGDEAKQLTAAAREQGLLLLACGLYGNVIRLLPPLTATDEELDRGLSIIERSLS